MPVFRKKSGVSRMLGKQLFRAGTSIGANVEEAQGGQSRADFISKISIARKEARETLYWLRLLSEAKFISPGKLTDVTGECNELISILTAIIKKNQKS
jgi:four helix bundle protein